jgi:hypothetical protein
MPERELHRDELSRAEHEKNFQSCWKVSDRTMKHPGQVEPAP